MALKLADLILVQLILDIVLILTAYYSVNNINKMIMNFMAFHMASLELIQTTIMEMENL